MVKAINHAYKEDETIAATCCSKIIPIEEAILNHGMCNEHMDEAMKELNKK